MSRHRIEVQELEGIQTQMMQELETMSATHREEMIALEAKEEALKGELEMLKVELEAQQSAMHGMANEAGSLGDVVGACRARSMVVGKEAVSLSGVVASELQRVHSETQSAMVKLEEEAAGRQADRAGVQAGDAPSG